MVLFGFFRNAGENDSPKFIREVEEKSELVVDECFRNALWLAKASEALKEVGNDLSERGYRSKVLVLNGMIEQKLRAASEIINANIISTLIFEFDSLLQAGSSLKKSDDLEAFHCYARCLFFSRIGDFLSNPNYEHRYFVEVPYKLAVAAYALALNAAINASPILPRLSAAVHLEALTLKILLNENETDYINACEDPQVGLYLYQCCGGKDFSRKNAFILRSASLPSYCPLSSISSEEHIAKISPILNEAEVLRRVFFMVAYDKEISSSSLSFMDTFFASLPPFPDDGDLQSFSADKTMSLLDIKAILVIAGAKWLALQSSSKIRHPIYFPSLSRQMLTAWKFIVEKSNADNKLSILSKVKLCNVLEMTRLRGELPDIRIIGRVCIWLQKHGDPNGRMFKLYGNTIVGLEKDTLRAIQNSHTAEPIFPQKFDDINTEEEGALFEEVRNILTHKDSSEEPEIFVDSSATSSNLEEPEQDVEDKFDTVAPSNSCERINDIPADDPCSISECNTLEITSTPVKCENDDISLVATDSPLQPINHPLLKRLKGVVSRGLLSEPTVDLLHVAAVCGLAEDPRQNGFFEAVQSSAIAVENVQ